MLYTFLVLILRLTYFKIQSDLISAIFFFTNSSLNLTTYLVIYSSYIYQCSGLSCMGLVERAHCIVGLFTQNNTNININAAERVEIKSYLSHTSLFLPDIWITHNAMALSVWLDM